MRGTGKRQHSRFLLSSDFLIATISGIFQMCLNSNTVDDNTQLFGLHRLKKPRFGRPFRKTEFVSAMPAWLCVHLIGNL
jgi:hypothetical protein